MLTVKTAMELKGLSTKGIDWTEDIDHTQQAHYWHDGQLCSLECSGVTFSIEAVGDIRFSLLEKGTDKELVFVKDRIGSGTLEHELRSYITTDDELIQAINDTHPKYEAIFDDCNWFECVIIYKDEVIESYVLSDEKLVDAIAEVRRDMVKISTDIIVAALPF